MNILKYWYVQFTISITLLLIFLNFNILIPLSVTFTSISTIILSSYHDTEIQTAFFLTIWIYLISLFGNVKKFIPTIYFYTTLFLVAIFIRTTKKHWTNKIRELLTEIKTLKDKLVKTSSTTILDYEKKYSKQLRELKNELLTLKVKFSDTLLKIFSISNELDLEAILKNFHKAIEQIFSPKKVFFTLKIKNKIITYPINPKFDEKVFMYLKTFISSNQIKSLEEAFISFREKFDFSISTYVFSLTNNNSEIIGFLIIEKDDFSSEELKLLKFLTRYLSISIDNIMKINFSQQQLKLIKKLNEKEREEKLKLAQSFSKYVSPVLLEEILKQQSLSLGGKKQKVTVLFSDIRGFTSISEKLDPQNLVQILNKHFQIATDCILNYKGLLDKFIGDAVMGLFGVPITTGQDPLNAVKAAICFQKKMSKLNKVVKEKFNVNLGVGIGINTGEALVGNIGSDKKMDYTAIGDAVNTASRIQALAKAGEILITSETYIYVKDFFECKFLGEFKVKGKEKQIKIYLVKYDNQ